VRTSNAVGTMAIILVGPARLSPLFRVFVNFDVEQNGAFDNTWYLTDRVT